MTDFAANEYDFYALDTWKIGRRLTLNYGARLNHMGWWYNKRGAHRHFRSFEIQRECSDLGIHGYPNSRQGR